MIIQTITDQAKAENQQHDRQTGKDGQPGSKTNHRLRLAQHAAPAWHGRLHTKTNIGQSGLGHDSECELNGGLHNQQATEVRQNMLQRNR